MQEAPLRTEADCVGTFDGCSLPCVDDAWTCAWEEASSKSASSLDPKSVVPAPKDEERGITTSLVFPRVEDLEAVTELEDEEMCESPERSGRARWIVKSDDSCPECLEVEVEEDRCG